MISVSFLLGTSPEVKRQKSKGKSRGRLGSSSVLENYRIKEFHTYNDNDLKHYKKDENNVNSKI